MVMVRTQIQLTEEQARKLRVMAARRGVSVAALVREGVDAVVEGDPRCGALGRAERIAQLKRLWGQARSGLSDVAERHDDYLEEAYLG
jgi:hypothetical protein